MRPAKVLEQTETKSLAVNLKRKGAAG